MARANFFIFLDTIGVKFHHKVMARIFVNKCVCENNNIVSVQTNENSLNKLAYQCPGLVTMDELKYVFPL